MGGRRVKKPLRACVIILVVLIVTAEVAGRFAGWPHFPQDPAFVQAPEWSYPRYIDKDPELFWRYRPNQIIRSDFFSPGQYTINNHGFHSPDFAIEKPADRMRVVCMGGSTTFGLGVGNARCYPRQLETALNHLDPQKRRWDVINAGVTDYSTFQGIALAERWLPQLNPDIVLFNFSFGDHQRASHEIADADQKFGPAWAFSLENTLMRSAACQWGRRLWQTISPPGVPDTSGTTPEWRVNITEFNANFEHLLRAAKQVQARSIVISSPISWPPPGKDDYSGLFHYHHRYHRIAEYAALYSDAEYCDLANLFNLHPEFYDDPVHNNELFNERGHAYAGEILAQFILGLPLDTAGVNPIPAQP